MNINIRHIIVILVSALWLTACSDFDGGDATRRDQDGMLSLLVPAPAMSTRDAGEGPDELKYTSLVFFAFPAEEGNPYIKRLPIGNGNLNFVNNSYRQYAIDLKKGVYRLYAVANFFPEGTELPDTEEALKVCLLNFKTFDFKIPDTGIPMSADPTDFRFEDKNVTISSLTDNKLSYDGKGGQLYCDLTFCYAKVTVRARDIQENPRTCTDFSVSNYSETSPVLSISSFNYGRVESSEVFTPYSISSEEEGTTTPKAYTFYVPERYVDDASSCSILNFKVGDTEIPLPLGEIDGMENGQTYPTPTSEDKRIIRRGTEYRYTLSSGINLEVMPWSPETLTTNLAGTVYLHLESQEYEVTSGRETAIWYESDASDVRVESPHYVIPTRNGSDAETVNLYDYSVDATQDTIRVWVNTSIPSDEYEKIRKSVENKEGKYEYFHIVAGNIHKRIQVTPLNLEHYLIVNPEEVSLDVKLRVASGEYEGNIPISIRSNYPKVKVELLDGWDDINNGSDDPLQLMSPTLDEGHESVEVTKETPHISYMTGGLIRYQLNFSGLNSGLDIWKMERTLTFKVTGLDGNDNPIYDDYKTVTIRITPPIYNYKIHFKSEKEWTLPHIYVYQCLEFPSDYTGTFGDTPLANKPIGYRVEGNKNREAALEYSFTGAIAFKGWDSPINHALLFNSDGSSKAFVGDFEEGFYIFTRIPASEWQPKNIDSPRYYFDYDFCSKHREEIVKYCPECAWESPTKNRIWPGIMMKLEGDGWYEFELTGIAEPGKTLIMFANTHNGNSNDGYRYPGAYKVGEPLFDYPSHEGWLLFNGDTYDRINNKFTPTKPE